MLPGAHVATVGLADVDLAQASGVPADRLDEAVLLKRSCGRCPGPPVVPIVRRPILTTLPR